MSAAGPRWAKKAERGAPGRFDQVILRLMQAVRKITVAVPADLLENAQKASGAGIKQTVCKGLQFIAASRRSDTGAQAYDALRRLRARVRFSRSLDFNR